MTVANSFFGFFKKQFLFLAPAHRSNAQNSNEIALHEDLLRSESECLHAIGQTSRPEPPIVAHQLSRFVKQACRDLKAAGSSAVAMFGSLSTNKIQAQEIVRYFRWINGCEYRPAAKIAVENALIIIVFSIFGEGFITAILLIGGGDMGYLLGFAYGLIIALANVGLSVLAGFLPGRGIIYRLRSPEPEANDGAIRALSWFGIFTYIATVFTLHFTAARVRATGSHQGRLDPETGEYTGLFDFTDIGFWATFDEATAIWIMVVGVCGAVLGFREGFCGLSDRIIGYSATERQASETFEAIGAELRETTLDGLDDRAADARDFILEQRDLHANWAQEHHDNTRIAKEKIRSHNHAIDQANEAAKQRLKRDVTTTQAVRQKKVKSPELDFNQFEKHRIAEIDDVSTSTPGDEHINWQHLLSQLETTHSKAVAKVQTAYAEFQSTKTAFSFYHGEIENEEDTDPDLDPTPASPAAANPIPEPAEDNKTNSSVSHTSLNGGLRLVGANYSR